MEMKADQNSLKEYINRKFGAKTWFREASADYKNSDEPPLNVTIFSPAQLRSHAQLIAQSHEIELRHTLERLLPRLKENEQIIREGHRFVASAVNKDRPLSPAAEWLLDNYYIIEEQIQIARDLLPASYSKELPKLRFDPGRGYPLVYAMILELISHTDGRVDLENLTQFTEAYQQIRPLKLGELWAIPIMLRLALIENLRRVTCRIVWRRKSRDLGLLWAERFVQVANNNPKELILALADFAREVHSLQLPMVAELASRLRGQHASLGLILNWIEHQLAEHGQGIDQALQAESHDQAANQASISNSISSLRILNSEDWPTFVEKASATEKVLLQDPGGVHGQSDFNTRDRCRHVVEELSKRSQLDELAVANLALGLAKERVGNTGPGRREQCVGYFLLAEGRSELEALVRFRSPIQLCLRRTLTKWPFFTFLTAVGLLALLFAMPLCWMASFFSAETPWWNYLAALPLLLVASRPAIRLANWGITHWLPPRSLPRLDFSKGIPAAHRTAVVVPTMLTNPACAQQLVQNLELRYLANRDPNLRFVLLTDFADAQTEVLSSDRAILNAAHEALLELNARHAAPNQEIFFLLHRPRLWNSTENCWMGYERKRGKLEDFNQFLLSGNADCFQTVIGNLKQLAEVRYVITLDTDTQLPPNSAWKMIGTIAHPLNRPTIDPRTQCVRDGYSVLQPRISIGLLGAERSLFAKLFSGQVGLDPYTREISNSYHDLFGSGQFIGKGIYDVAAFHEVVGKRFPENLILSHDLIEGCHARCGFLSDVELIEDHPARYLADVNRRRRWIRGDWQIAAWLRRQVPHAYGQKSPNPLGFLSQWMLLDNLCRSLASSAFLFLLIAAWFMPLGNPLAFTGLLLVLWFLPQAINFFQILLRPPKQVALRTHWAHEGRQEGQQLLVELLQLCTMPYEALGALGAIAKVFWRKHISRRLMLEWQTAHDAERNARTSCLGTYWEMKACPELALLASSLLWVWRPEALIAASPFLFAWFVAPLVAWYISRTKHTLAVHLKSNQVSFLRRLARRTYAYFEEFCVEKNNWLPPDNYQEFPNMVVAERTSPTNIGLGLLSTVSAYDFGFASARQTIERLQKSLAALEALQRYRGHFLNWYDTRNGQPLPPSYVSTVDSGNLVATLIALRGALQELISGPSLPVQWKQGLEDSIGILLEELDWASAASNLTPHLEAMKDALHRQLMALKKLPNSLPEALSAFKKFQTPLAEIERISDRDSEVGYWVRATRRQCSALCDDLLYLAPWLEEDLWSQLNGLPVLEAPENFAVLLKRLASSETLPQIAGLSHELAAQFEQWSACASEQQRSKLNRLAAAIDTASQRAGTLISNAEDLIQRTRELAEVDLDFLYDPKRKLLSIGFSVERQQLDPGCYDLLASEARLASFLGIAQGKLPQEHWFMLGRRLVSGTGPKTLVSWSGSMFEYLMPLLVMPCYENTLLSEACDGAVLRQIRFGKQRKVPWGISESCYNQFDRSLTYQYRAFGVPELGLKRGLANDLVTAPYASAMALMVEPEKACANLEAMARLGFMGRFGFYEAVDYTASRIHHDQSYTLVRSHMAHHSGMTLLSISRALLERPMQRRFMRDPECCAASLLLQERVPLARRVSSQTQDHQHAPDQEQDEAKKSADRHYTTANTPVPEVHMLSNGHYSLMINNAGGGFSQWNGLALTRWREDIAQDEWGTFFYVQDVESGEAWSTAFQPMRPNFDSYEVVFSQGRTEILARKSNIDIRTLIAVSPEDDIEIRRITLTNHSSRKRTLELTSYMEVVLLEPRAELSHPAFQNLFVETEALAEASTLLATRRSRAADEKPPWMFHSLSLAGAALEQKGSYETDRARFVGRNRSLDTPAALTAPGPLSGTVGAVLDPIFAIRHRITLEAGQAVTLDAISGAAPTRAEVVALADRYRNKQLTDRVFDVAWTHSQVMLHQLRATPEDAQVFARISASLVYTNARYRSAPSLIARNRRGQSDLWHLRISGDLPIVLVRITEPAGLVLARRMIQAHSYWRNFGLRADLVFWVDSFSGYRQNLLNEITGIVNTDANAKIIDQPAGIFLHGSDQLNEDDQVLLQAMASLMFSDQAGTLEEQVNRRIREPAHQHLLQRTRWPELPSTKDGELPARQLSYFNGLGGFTPDGKEYVVQLPFASTTPAPWVNVLANPEFGTIVSESGASYTWFQNAHEYRLTPWHNDPLSDPSGEAFYIRDEETGRYWSPTPAPARGYTPYVCRHGLGYSAFEHTQERLQTELLTYVATDAPVKFTSIKVRNQSDRHRRVSLTGYCAWVLGEARGPNAPHIVTRHDIQTGALFAANARTSEFAEKVAFFYATGNSRTHTGDRLEFIGRNATLRAPEALRRQKLSGTVGASFDPCAAMQVYLDIPPGEQREVVFILGAAGNQDEARSLLRRFGNTGGARQALESVWQFWKHLLGGIHIETPDASLNFLANNWLLYQVLSCRFWGRSGLYQSGGAYGFRDQLQDSMAFLLPCPWLTRPHLLRCASRQFREGDVQHWWHPPLGRGVRTKFSDDYLWLPLATCRYVLGTGDSGVLDETTPFLESRMLRPEEESYYSSPSISEDRATLYEHCVLALRRAAVWGEHGLPLMGCGDWNDGMNRVGVEGKGESIWLAFFLCEVLRQFEKLALLRKDAAFAEQCRDWSAHLRKQLEAHAWDGKWYRRAFFDDGRVLGSQESPECQIDLLPQSWSVLSGAAQPERADQAMQSVLERLVDSKHRLIQLFTPPFDKAPWDPGYIRGYVPGVRENGGQYTHAAVWAAMAFAARGNAKQAWRLFDYLNPIKHGDTKEHISTYKVEPYVLAADVYTLAGHEGQGGWTWYTGSASWMYRLILESLLGMTRENDRLIFAPVLPPDWNGYRMHYRYHGTTYHIEVVAAGPERATVRSVRVDEVESEDKTVHMIDDHQEHNVRVEMG